MKQENLITVYPSAEAKKLFKRCRRRGLIVDIGRSTGNIWSGDHKRKLAWLLKDFCDNWIIEKLRPVSHEVLFKQLEALKTAIKFAGARDKFRLQKQIRRLAITLKDTA